MKNNMNFEWGFYDAEGYYVGSLQLDSKTPKDALKKVKELWSSNHTDAAFFRKTRFNEAVEAFSDDC